MPGSRDAAAAAEGRLFPSDLDAVADALKPQFERIRGARIFLTGGSGFVGRWLLETLLWANSELSLGVKVTVLTRDPLRFKRRSPHLAQSETVRMLRGDIRSFSCPSDNYDLLLHLAAETNTGLSNPDATTYVDVIVGGTRHVLDFVDRSPIGSLLFVSSGAVYGTQPDSVERLREDDPYGPSTVTASSAYGEAKRCAELLVCARAETSSLRATVARCFAFVGPYLPLASGFAVGNFIGDALARRPVVVHGDGTPLRTYMYASDMAIWLWKIAIEGRSQRPYNVGSPAPTTIRNLADAVAAAAGSAAGIEIRGSADQIGVGHSYVPDVGRAQSELGLEITFDLEAALARTIAWYAHAPIGNVEAAS